MGIKVSDLKPFWKDAKRLLDTEGVVGEVSFTKGVYQVEIKEGDEIQWPFLQISEDGELKEAFCTCDVSPCHHLALAYLRVFEESDQPLHVRFFRSFWFYACWYAASHLGYQTSPLAANPLFQIKSKSQEAKKFLQGLEEKRPSETPENSLKFSNLSQEEIDKWKEGRPSPELRFLLSPWFDCAKWLFLNQDEAELEIQKSPDGEPIALHLQLKVAELTITPRGAAWDGLIPSMRTLPKGPAVHSEPQGDIESVDYLPSQKSFKITHNVSKASIGGGVQLGDNWLYKQREGFFPLTGEPFFNRELITTAMIPHALTYHMPSMRLWCRGVKFFQSPIKASYSIVFDEEWNWHFELFLKEPGDLSKGESALFGEWVYLDKKGFYPIKGALFPTIKAIVPEAEVNAFIQKNRIWLNTQKGFETHLAHMDSQMLYSFDLEKGLSFVSRLSEEQGQAYHDFGEWIYFEAEGFFSKSHQKLHQTIVGGLKVPLNEVGAFIRKHQEALEGVEGFFCETSVVEEVGLRVMYLDGDSIQIKPQTVLRGGRSAPIFGDYLYLENEGFIEIPTALRLPLDYQQPCTLAGAEAAVFLTESLPKLTKHLLYIDPRLKKISSPKVEIHYLVKSAGGGLKAGFQIPLGGGVLSLREIYEAFQQEMLFYSTEEGYLDLTGEDLSWIRHLTPSSTDDEYFELSTLDFLRLDSFAQFTLPKNPPPHFEIAKRLITQLREFSMHERPVLKGLKSELRHYQQNGVNWLWFLYSFGLSGLLCDDMGLGKTHQSMGLMAAIHGEKKEKPRFLVVCPTSVIYHWEDKLAQYLPDIKVHTFHGQKRKWPGKKFDGIFLTSYGTLRVERKRLKDFTFTLAVFDEVHLAKNASSITHSVLSSLQVGMRLGLTGTPIENNLKELKALFDIVLPGLMPSPARFRERFLIPIEKNFDQESKALLSALIRPFVLRRRKQEVLKELPEKTEDKSFCELYQEQRALYKELVELSNQQFVPELRKRDAIISYVHIFAVLGKLKQICNHPALFHKDIDNYKAYESGKWDLFVEKLQEARESSQKVVVFSQYLGMLDIMKLYFKEQGWEYAEIRGDTKNRREELKRFKDDPNCMIFLGSIQAAGLGIDLTSAEVVIFYDRWWNAAKENQAIDRVHRMGQTRGVQVYKLITKGTLEERIDQLITKKGRLMEEVVTSDEAATLKTFTRSELIEILSFSSLSNVLPEEHP
jgi:superfamily II DNA or RNA helicase